MGAIARQANNVCVRVSKAASESGVVAEPAQKTSITKTTTHAAASSSVLGSLVSAEPTGMRLQVASLSRNLCSWWWWRMRTVAEGITTTTTAAVRE